MTSYSVRPAEPRDASAVRELTHRSRRELSVVGRRGRRAPRCSGSEHVWVVEAGRREIVGVCGVCDLGEGHWELHALYLEPVWRGFGLGRALVEHAVRTVRNEGGLDLSVRPSKVSQEMAARARRLGFDHDGGNGGPLVRRIQPPS